MDILEMQDHIQVSPDVLDWWVDLYDPDVYTLSIIEKPIRDSNSRECCGKVPGGVCIDFASTPESAQELATDIIAGKMFEAMHEGLEWVRVDNQRIANPHPKDFSKVQLEIGKQCREIVREYVQKYSI